MGIYPGSVNISLAPCPKKYKYALGKAHIAVYVKHYERSRLESQQGAGLDVRVVSVYGLAEEWICHVRWVHERTGPNDGQSEYR
jgi:hypothetical protein